MSHEGLRQPIESTMALRRSLPMTFDELCSRKTNDVHPKVVAPGHNPINGDASGNLRVDGGEPVDRFRYAATSIDARPRWRRYISAAQSHAGCCRNLSRSRSAASGNGPGNGYGNSSGNRIGKSSAAAVKSATVKLAPTRYPDG